MDTLSTHIASRPPTPSLRTPKVRLRCCPARAVRLYSFKSHERSLRCTASGCAISWPLDQLVMSAYWSALAPGAESNWG